MWRILVAIGTAGVLWGLPLPAAAGSGADRALLERYRPVLRYSAAEQFFAQPVSLPPDSAEVVPGDRVYGHVASEAGETWLQYWFFYAENPQDRGLLRTGRHEGDWELFQIRLGDDGRPEVVTMSQHSWAEGCAWGELEHTNGGRTPVLYVANASHAVYAKAGDHDRPFPDPTDEADGNGPQTRPAVIPIDDQAPDWVRYPGRWGMTEAGWIPGEAPSPRGPRFHEDNPWTQPSTFHADVARACGAGAPGRWWALPALVGVGAILGVLTLLATRAFRRRRSA